MTDTQKFREHDGTLYVLADEVLPPEIAELDRLELFRFTDGKGPPYLKVEDALAWLRRNQRPQNLERTNSLIAALERAKRQQARRLALANGTGEIKP